MYPDIQAYPGKRIRVPNYDVEVRPHEQLVINTLTFQRLFNIKQLGLAYLVYPYATHMRGAHSLDCLYWAQRIVNSLTSKAFLDPEKNTKQIEIIRLAALLHDVMHLPFGHALEDEIGILPRHDKSNRIDIMLSRVAREIPSLEGHPALSLAKPSKQDYEKALGLLEDVRKVLWTIALHDEENSAGKPTLESEYYYMADIIGNTMCADLLAYIDKDVDFTGIEKKPGGYRIFDYMELAEDKEGRTRLAIRLTKAGIRPDIISAIQGILEVRYVLTEQVIYHHAKCAASAMLGKLSTLCGITESEELYKIGDEGFMALLEQKITSLPERTQDGRPLREAATNLLTKLESRNLHKRVYRITETARKHYDSTHATSLVERYRSPSAREAIENLVESTFGLEPGSVILFCPLPKMALKEARVMVVYDKVREALNGTAGKPVAVELRSKELAQDYPDISSRVLSLESQYLSLWSFYGFLDPEKFGYSAGIKSLLEELIEVKSDELLELYLNEKKPYQESKRIELAQAATRKAARAQVYGTVLEAVARGGSDSIDDDTLKLAIDTAYQRRRQNKSARSDKPTGDVESMQKELPLS
ncbi:MAG: HD domain-containing protein [Dehalococcoidia bacterium]